jgi:Protein of unknown function (DUF3105)
MAKGKSPQAKGRTGTGKARRPPLPVTARRQTPWGLIAATLAVVVFAVAVIGYAVLKVRENAPVDAAKGLSDAKKIPGIVTESIKGGEHTTDPVSYAPCLQCGTKQPHSPPIGGRHDPTWADCGGTVYTAPIRNENAVHTLEHGSVWITYRPDLPAGDVDQLKGVVDGKNYTLMSPYPGLKSAVSLQAWGYQLFLDKVDMKLVKRFLRDLRDNVQNAPEPHGQCSSPEFKVQPLPPGPTPTAAPAPTGSPTPRPSGSDSPAPSPTATKP